MAETVVGLIVLVVVGVLIAVVCADAFARTQRRIDEDRYDRFDW